MAGGFVGGFLGYFFTSTANSFGVEDESSIFKAIVNEILGSFFLAFLYLTQTENKTKMSNDPAITTLIIASAYLAAMLMCSGPDDYLTPLNPAVSLGQIFQQIFHNEWKGLKRIYIYLPFPLVGGILAVLFHEFIYKRVQE
jgi:glycerol uptake facilitator-like aquaporin